MQPLDENNQWLSSLKQKVQESEKNWWTTFLCSLFFGWLGVDRFYLNDAFGGFIKLFTLGMFGVWWAFDLVQLCCNRMKDGEGAIVRTPF